MYKVSSLCSGFMHWMLRSLPSILKILVAIFLVGYLLNTVSLSEVTLRIKTIPIHSLVLAYLFICLQVVFGAFRWMFVLLAIGAKLDLLKAIKITFISLFFNQFFPASVGADIVRVWQSRRAGLDVSVALSSVVLERFGNLFTIILMALFVLPFWSRNTQVQFTLEASTAVGLSLTFLLTLLMLFDRIPVQLHHWRVVRALAALSRHARALFLHPIWAALTIASSVSGQVALAAAVFVIAVGLGVDMNFVDCLVLMPPVVLISALPISVAGWGIRELAMVTALGVLNVPQDSALAVSLILGLIATAVALPGGIIWLFFRSASE
jgi:uncharacterized protein (TIRG00374 family)